MKKKVNTASINETTNITHKQVPTYLLFLFPLTGVNGEEGLFYTARKLSIPISKQNQATETIGKTQCYNDCMLILFSQGLIRNRNIRSQIGNDWATVAPILLVYDKNNPTITKELSDFYLNQVSPSKYVSQRFSNLTAAFSDRLFFTATDISVSYHAMHSPVYYYLYTYQGQFSISDIRNVSGSVPPAFEIGYNLAKSAFRRNVLGQIAPDAGACHGDELALLFRLSLLNNVPRFHRDYEMSKAMVRTWVQFASDM